MALKQLKLQAELRQKKTELEKLEEKKAGFDKRTAELEVSLEEAKTEEDTTLVSESIDALESEMEQEGVDEKITTIQGEIEQIESELSDLEERGEKVDEKSKTETNKRGDVQMNRYQAREQIKTGEYYERSEVKQFYEAFKNLRAVGGEGLTIPDIVVNRIMDIMGDYSTLYPLVDKIRTNGTTRILIDTDTTAATWIEQTGAIPTGEVGTITNIDFDGYKIGKLTFVDNCMLQDSIINLDDYVTKKIARAIALGLDLAILKGEGASAKQPEGILTKLSSDHKVTVSTGNLVDIVSKISLIDTGKDSVGEIVSVMHRKTYYNRFLRYTINVNSAGDIVGKLPNITKPDLLGLRVVFNNNMDEDIVLFGDFEKYTLVERENIAIDKSEHVKFQEDQMAFRGKGRFDGKPTKPEAFVLVTMTDAATEAGDDTTGTEEPSGN